MSRPTSIVTDFASAEMCRKGFSVSDAVAKSTFGYEDAVKMGFSCDAAAMNAILESDPELKKYAEKVVADAGLALGAANIDALGQFFTIFLEQTINVLYRGRTAAQTFGVKTVGDWTTERIALKLRELTASPSIYDDWSRAPYASYNYGWDVRDTLRMEWALEVTKLEEAAASVMRRNAYKDKMDAITLSNAIWTNEFFWYGAAVARSGATWNKRLYGVLTEPNLATRRGNLPVDPADDALTTADMIAALRLVKQDMADDLNGAAGDIDQIPIELACPLSWQTAFTVPNQYSFTPYKWLAENWKNATVTFKPELNSGDDGDPIMIAFVRSVPDVGVDTINLFETSKLRLVGAMPSVKGREEAYSSSVAGAVVAAPMAVKLWAAGGSSGS